MRSPNFLSNLLKQLFHDKSDRKQDDVVQPMIDIYYDVYLTGVLLEKRFAEKLQAFEGILIVKERKENNN